MRSVPAGTSGVRTVASVQPPLIGRVLRSVQYCQPAVVSCRKRVSEVSGVVDLYQSPRSYCLPTLTTGAHSADSVISALRSPSVRRVSSTFMALEPEWASADGGEGEVVVAPAGLLPAVRHVARTGGLEAGVLHEVGGGGGLRGDEEQPRGEGAHGQQGGTASGTGGSSELRSGSTEHQLVLLACAAPYVTAGLDGRRVSCAPSLPRQIDQGLRAHEPQDEGGHQGECGGAEHGHPEPAHEQRDERDAQHQVGVGQQREPARAVPPAPVLSAVPEAEVLDEQEVPGDAELVGDDLGRQIVHPGGRQGPEPGEVRQEPGRADQPEDHHAGRPARRCAARRGAAGSGRPPARSTWTRPRTGPGRRTAPR